MGDQAIAKVDRDKRDPVHALSKKIDLISEVLIETGKLTKHSVQGFANV